MVFFAKYEINVFEVANQIKILNENVDLDKLIPNAYSIFDMESAKLVTDSRFNGVISFTKQDGYSITSDKVAGNMSVELRFTDKQIGAIIDNLIANEAEIMVQLGSEVNLKDYGFKLVQVQFSNITETTTITKGTNSFEYTTEGKSLVINNLSSEETDSIMSTVNTFLKLGTAKEFSKIIADTFVNVLIGNESSSGLAYSLKDAGSTDFSFETDGTHYYFVIKYKKQKSSIKVTNFRNKKRT